jgi:hypothetical protein
MKLGLAAVIIGLPLLGLGVFLLRGGQIAATAYSVGLTMLAIGVARLLWAGLRGNIVSWLFVAPAAGILTWTLYELIRQSIPLPEIGVLDEMTAPTLTAAVMIGIVAIGVFHFARSRDIERR